MTKPPVHLWIYNHPFNGISDQVDYFVMALAQHGYTVTVGRQPSLSALNVVIENFTEETKKVLMAFCRGTRKRVFVIMTEHIDFDGRQIFIHGDPLWSENDYMHPATQLDRLKNLLECLPCIRGLMVLGDLPELRNIASMLPGVALRRIPFPQIAKVGDGEAKSEDSIKSDLLFTGVLTDYRADMCAELKKKKFSIVYPHTFVSRRRRDLMNRAAKIILNIPQREGWGWLSGMRIIAALRSGRATISLGTKDVSKIAGCCPQIDVSGREWPALIENYVANWRLSYRDAHAAYTGMAREFEAANPFPDDAFEYWAITDRVIS